VVIHTRVQKSKVTIMLSREAVRTRWGEVMVRRLSDAVYRRLPLRARRAINSARQAPRGVRGAILRSPMGSLATRSGSRQILHCFGDSHAFVFVEIAKRDLLPHTWFDVVSVDGATALGMANPNSKTAALPTFRGVIDRLPADRKLLFLLGEVDCGFVIWYRAQKYGVSVDDEMAASLDRYTRFLRELLDEGRRNVFVAAVPPPTILDGGPLGPVGNARREVTASLPQRARLTKEYNDRLREWTRANACHFVDYEADVADASGLVRSELRSRNPLEHHLERGPYSRVVAEHLSRFGFS
jgi:hypothetical protein